MAEMIVFSLDMYEEAVAEFGEQLAEDPMLQQILADLEQWVNDQIARRDAEYAAQLEGDQE